MQAPILSHFVKFFYNSIHNFVVVTDNKTWFIIRHVPIVSQFYLKALNQFNVKHFVEMDRFQIFLTLTRDNVSIPAPSLIHLTLRLTSSDGQLFDDEETSRSVRVVNSSLNCIYHRDRLGYEESFGQNVPFIEIILVRSFDWVIIANKAIFIQRFRKHGD